MRNLINLSILLLFPIVLSAQTFEWVKQIENPDARFAPNDVVSDKSGNVYSLGTVEQYAKFKEDASHNLSTSDWMFYVCKRNAQGKLLWVVKSSANYSWATCLAIDNSANIYLAGNSSDG